jgi:WD40 repeat protein
LTQRFSSGLGNRHGINGMREHLVIGTEIATNSEGFALRRSMIVHQFELKLSGLLTAALVSAAFAFPNSILVDTAPPQSQLKTFPLHNRPHSADISPDEKLVVTESTFQSEVGDAAMRQFTEVVQLWNFEEDKLVAEFRLPKVEVRPYAKDYSIDPIRAGIAVRFTPDGSRVAALVDRRIHVLHTADMKELHSFQLSAPNEFKVRAMEVAPTGDLAAVLWVTERLHGRVDIYDLASGATVQSWDTPLGWIEFTRGLAWHPNGKLLLLAIPNATPCMAPTNQPDVFAFDVMTGAIKQKFTTGLLTGSIAVSADGRVLAVDENCLGVFANHDPKLRVFELSTGKKIREVSGRGAGVRYSVSISADGSRFLAFTGKVKMKFDWSDAVPQDVRVDGTFSVWNLSNYEGVVTSQNLPGLNAQELRPSPKGGYAVSVGKASFVYELPGR